MFGRVIHEWPLSGYSFHHHVLELPNGNFLATVTKNHLSTIQDHVIEIDRETGTVVKQWDLRASLDSQRRTRSSNSRDWFHGNGLAYDEKTDAIIASGNNQGVVKLTRNNEVLWILAPHRGWDLSGNGTDLKTKLLQPLDANGKPITDLRVVAGYRDHSEFSWTWAQHAPKLTLLIFDNGSRRNYTGDIRFSRAVEYHIDEDAMTIQQVWEYGRSTYSHALSDVDYHIDENTVVFMPGSNDEYGNNGKTIEIDYITKEVVYEAVIRNKGDFPDTCFNVLNAFPFIRPTNTL